MEDLYKIQRWEYKEKSQKHVVDCITGRLNLVLYMQTSNLSLKIHSGAYVCGLDLESACITIALVNRGSGARIRVGN